MKIKVINQRTINAMILDISSFDSDAEDIRVFVSKYLINLVLQTIFGMENDFKFDAQKFDYLVVNLDKMGCINAMEANKWIGMWTSAGRQLQRLNQELHQMIEHLINEMIERKEVIKNSAFNDLLDANMSMDEMISEVFILIAAAYDTSSKVIVSILYMLASHPNIQRKLFQELASLEDAPKSKYLNCVIKETLRLYDPVNIISRTSMADTHLVIEDADIYIPKSSDILINIELFHKSKVYWKHENDFIPERFLSPDTIKHMSYIPFSAGDRNCIGKQYALNFIQRLIADIVLKYEISTETKNIELKNDSFVRGFDSKIHFKFINRE